MNYHAKYLGQRSFENYCVNTQTDSHSGPTTLQLNQQLHYINSNLMQNMKNVTRTITRKYSKQLLILMFYIYITYAS